MVENVPSRPRLSFAHVAGTAVLVLVYRMWLDILMRVPSLPGLGAWAGALAVALCFLLCVLAADWLCCLAPIRAWPALAAALAPLVRLYRYREIYRSAYLMEHNPQVPQYTRCLLVALAAALVWLALRALLSRRGRWPGGRAASLPLHLIATAALLPLFPLFFELSLISGLLLSELLTGGHAVVGVFGALLQICLVIALDGLLALKFSGRLRVDLIALLSPLPELCIVYFFGSDFAAGWYCQQAAVYLVLNIIYILLRRPVLGRVLGNRIYANNSAPADTIHTTQQMEVPAMKTNNKALNQWIDECAARMKPDQIVLIDGSDEQLNALRQEAMGTGEIIELNQELLPGCYYHHSHPNDVARVEGRTFICCEDQADAGPTNNWMSPAEAREKVLPLYDGCMQGRTLYVIPYSMGPVGSKLSKIGIEITDSIYVVLSMAIMTRVGAKVLDVLGPEGSFVKGMHSKAKLSEEDRYILHFPQSEEIWSVNSGYGGNALLGKKCFALRIASTQGRDEGWMAEHMLILGVERPDGEIRYIAAAFPSACGKTNLAMLVPPEGYRSKGYKVWCVGDDIAWMRPGKDGRLYAMNPENGFFGVAPGTSYKTNPNAMESTRKNSIFTNVVRNLDDNTVWWEGMDNPPENAVDWLGNPWNGKTAEVKGAQPNSRFTAPATNCPCISSEFENPDGVPISAFVFGGRRARTAPLVFQSFDWKHGVFVGSAMASETTAAAAGQVGVVRRDPMAMLPFCGYNMGDYFAHWLRMESITPKPPKIFHVNWFKQDDNGKFIWPGFGENLRVLDWIIDRCEGAAEADETPIGYIPRAEDLNLEGLDLPAGTMDTLLAVDRELWKQEVAGIQEFYNKFDRLPEEMQKQLGELEKRLG